MNEKHTLTARRSFLATAAAAIAAPATLTGKALSAEQSAATAIVTPPAGKRVLLSCKLGMIAKEAGGRQLWLTERLNLAGQAGFDGVDLDQAQDYTPQQAREAASKSAFSFTTPSITHIGSQRLTSANEQERA